MQLTSRYSQIKNDEWDGILTRDDLMLMRNIYKDFLRTSGSFDPQFAMVAERKAAYEIIDEIDEALGED